jgi:hypothetical protein
MFMHVMNYLQRGQSSKDLQMDGEASKNVLADALNEVEFDGRGTKVGGNRGLQEERSEWPPDETRQEGQT